MITIDEWKNYEQRRTAIELLPKQIQVLLSSIWANNVLHIFEQKHPNDDRPRKAIEIAFDFALTGNAAYAVAAAYVASNAAYVASNAASHHASNATYAAAAAYAASNAASNAAYAAAVNASWVAYSAAYAAVYASAADAVADFDFSHTTYLRSIKEISFNPSWKTEQTTGIAKQIWENKNIGNLPILADALNDAGCEEDLTELRNIDQYTTLANWWLWNINLEKQ